MFTHHHRTLSASTSSILCVFIGKKGTKKKSNLVIELNQCRINQFTQFNLLLSIQFSNIILSLVNTLMKDQQPVTTPGTALTVSVSNSSLLTKQNLIATLQFYLLFSVHTA